jgi:hypothetical protein
METKKTIKVGDTVLIEQAWEDEAGNYHDEWAKVLDIKETGEVKLEFNTKQVNDFLADAEFNINELSL